MRVCSWRDVAFFVYSKCEIYIKKFTTNNEKMLQFIHYVLYCIMWRVFVVIPC